MPADRGSHVAEIAAPHSQPVAYSAVSSLLLLVVYVLLAGLTPVAAKDAMKALELAEQGLAKGVTQEVLNIISVMSATNLEAAQKLFGDFRIFERNNSIKQLDYGRVAAKTGIYAREFHTDRARAHNDQ